MTRIAASLPYCLTFAGRARRSDLWQFTALAGVALAAAATWDAQVDQPVGLLGPLMTLSLLLLIPPFVALTVRRLHDIGHSGRWAATLLLPPCAIGLLAMLLATPGARGSNRFGIDPKGRERRPAGRAD